MTFRALFEMPLCVLGLCMWLLAAPGGAGAATLTVVGDVNAGGTANHRFYTNVLAGGDSVLVARDTGPLSSVLNHYTTLGANVSILSGLLSAPKLASVDLLVLTAPYNSSLAFSASELAAARQHAEDGGSILMVLEAASALRLTEYNSILDGLGARIRFTGERFRSTETVGGLSETGLTEGMTTFQLSPYNTLSGGTASLVATNGVAIATEELGAPLVPAPIPLPPALPILAGGLLMLGLLRVTRRRR